MHSIYHSNENTISVIETIAFFCENGIKSENRFIWTASHHQSKNPLFINGCVTVEKWLPFLLDDFFFILVFLLIFTISLPGNCKLYKLVNWQCLQSIIIIIIIIDPIHNP